MTRAMRSILLSALFLTSVSATLAGDAEYSVTVTNLTRGQVFTPLLVVTHEPSIRPFVPGHPASVALEILAESGNTAPLAAVLSPPGEVAGSGGVLPPGQSVTVHVGTRGSADRISLAAMLVPTNDAFVALNAVPAPSGDRVSMFLAYAWDAGTEANDELCASIPGPPSVCNGEGFNPSRDGAEGYVHIHAGIHGIGDLQDADRDWRNPVARIVVTRTAGGPSGDDEGDDEDDD